MAKATEITFDKRVGRILRRHKSLSKGAVAQVGPDGLLTVRPRRTSLRFPWRSIVFLLALLVLAKAGLYAHLGADAYGEKLAQLSQGSEGEKIGAWMMKPDFATETLAGLIAPYL